MYRQKRSYTQGIYVTLGKVEFSQFLSQCTMMVQRGGTYWAVH